MAPAKDPTVKILMNVYKKQLIVIQMQIQIKVLLALTLLDHLPVNVKTVSCQTMSRLLMKEPRPNHIVTTSQNAKPTLILV